MSEIEKMYENAGLHKRSYIAVKFSDKIFTAEKQLELIKWLAKKDCMYRLTYERDFLWCSQLEWQSSFCYESFEQSLSGLINIIWQDLTDQERTEIADILRG